MLVDAFPGYNEISLAEFRIDYLREITDFVVIAESKQTHSGNPKPLIFSDWVRTKSSSFKDKIIILEIDLSSLRDAWSREIATRERLYKFVETEFPNSHYILSDLDEVPSLDQVRNATRNKSTHHFLSPTTFGYANWKLRDPVHSNWSRGVIGHTSLFPGENAGRYIHFPTTIESPGLHFSWAFHDTEKAMEKAGATAHTELMENPAMSRLLLNFAKSYGVDHLGRFTQPGFGVLEILRREQLTPIQQALFTKMPHFFKFDIEHPRLLTRWLASATCTALWNSSRCQRSIIQVALQRNRAPADIALFFFSITYQLLYGMAFWARRKIGRVLRGIRSLFTATLTFKYKT